MRYSHFPYGKNREAREESGQEREKDTLRGRNK
jgi:hypothetical protein